MSSPERRWRTVLDADARLGEGPVWHERSGRLLWVDVEAGLIHETNVDTCEDLVHEIGEPVSFVVPITNGGYAIGVKDGVGLLDTDWSEGHRIRIEAEVGASRMNDGKADPAGRLFAGTMTEDSQTSTLYRIDFQLTVHPVFGDIAISNGLAWSPDQSKVYYIDSPTQRIDVADYDVSTGAVVNRRMFARTPARGGYPDGMTIDREGFLWVAFWDGGCLRRFDPDGRLAETVELPVRRPTSCTFGGPGFDRLFVTSASLGLGRGEPGNRPGAGALLEVSVDVAGFAPATFSATLPAEPL